MSSLCKIVIHEKSFIVKVISDFIGSSYQNANLAAYIGKFRVHEIQYSVSVTVQLNISISKGMAKFQTCLKSHFKTFC